MRNCISDITFGEAFDVSMIGNGTSESVSVSTESHWFILYLLAVCA